MPGGLFVIGIGSYPGMESNIYCLLCTMETLLLSPGLISFSYLVLDENDETPLFNPQTVTVNLLENISTNSLIYTFTATDRDAASTPRNSEIE